jgi:ribonuclease-3
LSKPGNLDELEALIRHRFANRTLLEQSVTHASARAARTAAHDNERLEFLGDRVLGVVVAELLLETQPAASEGELARRFNKLVRRETCAEVARRLDLPAFLRLGDGEVASGGRAKENILADACEALLGALYLDAGFETTRTLVREFWRPLLDAAAPVPADPKTALQEWAQGRALGLPRYREIARSGPPHAPQFTTEVAIEGIAAAIGTGSSRRASEQAAARAMLEREGLRERDRE